ncbi:MAG: protein kinase [Bacteroidetes bacterium]|nr:protein kinase [Bacteroidota bacterium]MCW5895558.1 protein kinase [Bacteroidota bacterium]
MIGQTISHYKILEKLGEGGMGVVYKAQDTRLDRVVALKFLPHHLTASEAEQARFLQEAKASAALNHPNVCSVIDIQEVDGNQFIVMEYVDGKTLRHIIQSEIPNPQSAIAFAIQIGEALHEAHSKGIVHRDIKCENIMVNSRNQIKVMDFGLAKLKGSLKLTKTSSTVGTLAYMAPEQIQGGEVDARSDIFSFGVVLFEMLTGKLPFRGEHDAAVMYSILNEEPAPLSEYLPDAPLEITHIINKALEKNPDERYQSVSEMIVDLRRLKRDSSRVSRTIVPPPPTSQTGRQSAAPSASQPSPNKNIRIGIVAGIAVLVVAGLFLFQPWKSGKESVGPKKLVVLPFENLGDPEKEYFADGITDEITGRLSRLSGLGVIARASAREYKKTPKSVKQIGAELGVDYVLMGTVRWSGGEEQRVRVNPELISVQSALQTWSQPFEATYSDAFKIQADVASEVARALNIQLLQHESEKLKGKLTENAQAYDYYLRGREYENRSSSRADREIAVEQYERAIALDPSFAAAYARLAAAHAGMYWFFYDRTAERVEKARVAAGKALAIAPDLSEAHEAMGWYHYHTQLDYESAIKEFSIALKLDPNNPEVSYGLAAVYRRQGNMKESITHWRKVIVANPRASEIERQLGETLTLDRQYEEADKHYQNAIQLAPDNEQTYGQRALNLLLRSGDLGSVTEVIEQGRRYGRSESSEDQLLSYMVFKIELIKGNYDAAENAVSRVGLENQFVFYPKPLLLAHASALRGATGQARTLYQVALQVAEKRLKEAPQDERAHSTLGIAYAGLGRTDEAIKAARKGVELLPPEREAWRGGYRLMDLARVYTMVGEQEKALDALERLLSIPSDLSAQLLKLDPTWKPLRENKRFQALVKGR